MTCKRLFFQRGELGNELSESPKEMNMGSRLKTYPSKVDELKLRDQDSGRETNKHDANPIRKA